MNNQTDFFYYTLNLEDILKYTVFEIKKTGPYYFEINSSNPSQYDFNAYYIYQQFIGLPNYTQKVFSYFEDTNNIFLEHIKLGRSVIQSFSSKLLVQEYIEFQNNIQNQTYDTTMELNNDLLVVTWSIPIEPYTKTEIFTYN